MIHPDCREVIPLMPAPSVRPDGTANNDCERNAATRFMAQLRQDHPHRTCLITDERLSANAPHSETRPEYGCRDILGVTEGDHAYVFKHVQAAEAAGRVTSDARHDRAAGVIHGFRFVTDVPRNASRADVQVTCIESWEMGPDQVQHVSWVTDVRVSTRHVSTRMRGGRARGTIAHAPCNTLKPQGYTCAHTYGHGEQHLSVVFATRMLLACLVDQTPPRCCALLQAVWATRGSTRLLWERIRALGYDDALESMRALLEALWYGLQTSTPSVALDSS